MAVAIGAEQAVAEFYGAGAAAGVAYERIFLASGGTWFNGLLGHEIKSPVLRLMQGGGIRF